MVTKVGLAKYWMTLFDWPIPKTPSFVKILGLILNASWVLVFLCYHGNRGWSDTNFSHTVKSADPEPPVWRKNVDDISYTSWVIADFLKKFTNFCYHSNKGGSSENLNDSMWSANPQILSLVQNSRIYLKRELSYCDYFVCGNLQIFVTMATGVGLTQMSRFALPVWLIYCNSCIFESFWCSQM